MKILLLTLPRQTTHATSELLATKLGLQIIEDAYTPLRLDFSAGCEQLKQSDNYIATLFTTLFIVPNRADQYKQLPIESIDKILITKRANPIDHAMSWMLTIQYRKANPPEDRPTKEKIKSFMTAIEKPQEKAGMIKMSQAKHAEITKWFLEKYPNKTFIVNYESFQAPAHDERAALLSKDTGFDITANDIASLKEQKTTVDFSKHIANYDDVAKLLV